MKHFSLAAFSSERRIAALAYFEGTHLADLQLRHIPLGSSKAEGTVRQLVTRLFEREHPEFLAICAPSAKAGNRIRLLCEAVKDVAAQFDVSILEVDDMTLMSAFGHPPLRRKEYVRNIGRTIWPTLASMKSRRAAVDSAVTGLYVQTERLFSLHGTNV